MKMTRILISLAVLVGTLAYAAPVLQSPWTITTDPPTARAALHAVAEISGSATNLTTTSNNIVLISCDFPYKATPYTTLTNAIANASQNGDTIQVNGGIHMANQQIQLKTNLVISLLNGATILTTYTNASAGKAAIVPATGSTIIGGRIIGTNGFQYTYGNGGSDAASGESFLKWVDITGDSDALYGGEYCRVNMLGGSLNTRWDAVALYSTHARADLDDVTINVTAGNWTAQASGATGLRADSGIITAKNCRVNVSGSAVRNRGASIGLGNTPADPSLSRVELFNTVFNVSGTSPYDLHNNNTDDDIDPLGITPMFVTGCTRYDGKELALLNLSAFTARPFAFIGPKVSTNKFELPTWQVLYGDVAGATNANATTLFGSGTVPTARLGSGTANSGTVLYGDQTYKALPSAGVSAWRTNSGLVIGLSGALEPTPEKYIVYAPSLISTQLFIATPALGSSPPFLYAFNGTTLGVGSGNLTVAGTLTNGSGGNLTLDTIVVNGPLVSSNAAAANGANMKWNGTSLWITNPASSVIFNGTGIAPGVITNNIYNFTNGGYMIAFNASGANAGVAIRPRAGVDAGPNFASTSITAGGASVAAGSYSINNDASGAYFGSAGAGKIGRIYGGDGSGANNAGGQVQVKAGASTGTARGGPVELQTSPSSASSSTLNTAITRTRIEAQAKTLTESSATTVVSVSVASSKILGIHVSATTRAQDATDFQSVKDSFDIAAVNKAGTVTTAISTIGTATTANITSAGTLATTWTAVANGNAVDIKCSAVSSLTQTVLETYYRIEVDTDDQTMIITPQ